MACEDCNRHIRTWRGKSKTVLTKYYKDNDLIAISVIPKNMVLHPAMKEPIFQIKTGYHNK